VESRLLRSVDGFVRGVSTLYTRDIDILLSLKKSDCGVLFGFPHSNP
jgi:hypothetical protein